MPFLWKKNDFLGFSRASVSVAMGLTRPIFGAVSYVWGLNIRGNFQGHSSRASYICQVRPCLHFWRLRPCSGQPLDLCAQTFNGIIYYVIKSMKLEGFGFLARLVLEIWKRQHWHSYSGSADIGHVEHAKFSKYEPENVKCSYALFRRFVAR